MDVVRMVFAERMRVVIIGRSHCKAIERTWRSTSNSFVGALNWAASERFDVIAKGPADVPMETTRAMTRTLLGDRFELRSHRESRNVPAYALVVAREGRLGTNLRPALTGGVDRDSGAPRQAPPKVLPPSRRDRLPRVLARPAHVATLRRARKKVSSQRRRPIVIGVRARGAGDEPISCARSGLDA
jgi:uncharacterized protein (TIGR03435 family)